MWFRVDQQGDVETERHRKPAHFHFLYGVVQGDPSPPGRELVDVKPAGGRQEARDAGSVGWGGERRGYILLTSTGDCGFDNGGGQRKSGGQEERLK